MNNPFDDDFLGDDGPSVIGSQTTEVKSELDFETFNSTHRYAKGVLQTWNIALGELSYNYENNKTIKAILQLLSWRQKDLTNREKFKEEITLMQFQRDKYRSLLEQAKRTIEQKNKSVGRLQNLLSEANLKVKQIENQTKKCKEEDKKTIAMLKSKNEQVLHEVKKRQQELNKITEQLKKNTRTERAISNNGKSSFDLIQKLPSNQGNLLEDKIQYLTQKYDADKKIFLRQNLLLKQKIFDIREQIVEFAQWIDQNIFGVPTSYQSSFIINHNLLFRKESIVNQLKQLISVAKNGISQIQNLAEKKLQQKLNRKNSGLNSQRNAKQLTPRQKDSQIFKQLPMFKKLKSESPNVLKNRQIGRQMENSVEDHELGQLIDQMQDSQLSIISHVSITDLEKRPFSKWDILFPTE